MHGFTSDMKMGTSDMDFLAPTPALPRWGRELSAPPPSGGRPGGGPER
jgi:hypothetical protein